MDEHIKVPLIPECASCIMSSLKTMVPLLTSNSEKQAEYFAYAFNAISEGYARRETPVLLSISIYRDLYAKAGIEDPYIEIKRASTLAALRFLPVIEKKINGLVGFKRLRACLAASITGNLIDFNTAGHEPNLDNLVEMYDDIIHQGFAPDDSEGLWETLSSKTGQALFLADNAGEVILDIPLLRLMKELGWKTIVIVKGEPMINDATIEDVRGTEIEELAEIRDSGAWAHGVPLKYVSSDFLQLVTDSNLVISKGQANIETFPEIQARTKVETYYITRAKCPHISQAIGAKKGQNAVYRQPDNTK